MKKKLRKEVTGGAKEMRLRTFKERKRQINGTSTKEQMEPSLSK